MDKLQNKKIGIIGMGHMGASLTNGLLSCGLKKENLLLSNKSKDNKVIVAQADWIVIAVKPWVVAPVIAEVSELIKDTLILSVAAGVSVSDIQKYCANKNQKIIRLMPNINVSVNSGVIGMYFAPSISKQLKARVKKVFSTLGTVFEVDKETDLDSLLLISACGPAIISYFLEILFNNGKTFGLSKKLSEDAVLKTLAGTLLYLQKNKLSFADLQKLVATKGGITEEILHSMDKFQFKQIFAKSIQNGYAKLNKLKANIKKKEPDLT